MKRKLIFIILLFLIASCGVKQNNDLININNDGNSVSIGSNGININSSGTNVSIGANGININTSNTNGEYFHEEVKEIENSNIEGLSCEQEYNYRLNNYGTNFSDCYFNKPNLSSCEGKNINGGKINLVVIFDDSGSMGAKIGDETMLEIAKDKLSDYISNLGNETNLSFVLYGHKGAGTEEKKQESCLGVEEIYSFGDNNIDSLKSKIRGLNPNGWTPISSSLKKAKEMIQKQAKNNDKNIILLVSDGKETCGGNPLENATDISSSMKNTYIDVIGFNVMGETQKQLMEIAKNGKGNYFDVKSRLDFENTFAKTKNFLNTMNCGASKASIELSYGMDAIDKYYICISRVREEQVHLMVDSSDKCKSYFEEQLNNRFSIYENQFEPIKKQGEDILNNFSKLIKEVEDNF